LLRHVLNASTDGDLDAVFAKLGQLRASGLVISAGGPFLVSGRTQLAALAVRHAMPVVGADREFVLAGGLISYGADLVDAYRLTGG
jgi:putative ABC transport system substrate-binding protein